MTLPAYPLAVQPSAHIRLTYTREDSLSPIRSAVPTAQSSEPRRFSHSRGRPGYVYPGATERGRSVSTSAGTGSARGESLAGYRETRWGCAESSCERGRSESREGSRAPLWRSEGGLGTCASRVREIASRQATREKVSGESVDSGRERRYWSSLGKHFLGVRGDRALPTPVLPFLAHLPLSFETPLLTLLGTLPSILVCCALSTALARIGGFDETPLAVGSLGATAVLLYAVPEGPLSQPRNLVGGHMISALVGCVVSQLFALYPRFSERTSSEGLLLDNLTASITSWGSLAPVSASLAVALAVLAMQLTGTVHPPGGATALIAAFHQRPTPRWTYLLLIFLSVIWMGVWALVVNNLGRRRYPAYWGTPPPLDAPPVVGAPAPASPLVHDPNPYAEHLEHSPSHFSPSAPSAHDASSTQQEVNSSIEREQERDLQARWLGRLGEGDEVAVAKSEGVGAEEGDGRRAGSWKMKMEEEERGLRARR